MDPTTHLWSDEDTSVSHCCAIDLSCEEYLTLIDYTLATQTILTGVMFAHSAIPLPFVVLSRQYLDYVAIVNSYHLSRCASAYDQAGVVYVKWGVN